MLIVLTTSQAFDIPIWLITSVFAGVFIIEDLAFSLYYISKYHSLPPSVLQKEKQEVSKLYGLPENPNEFWIAIKRVPWKILPFIMVFFILVAGLNEYGAVDWLASMISKTSTTLGSSIATHGILGFLLANIINNQPMTILLSNVLLSDSLQISEQAFRGGAYAVVIASNLGANLTLIGALAGLMWRKILKTKGLEISYFDFVKTGLIITPFVFGLSLLSLYFVLEVASSV